MAFDDGHCMIFSPSTYFWDTTLHALRKTRFTRLSSLYFHEHHDILRGAQTRDAFAPGVRA